MALFNIDESLDVNLEEIESLVTGDANNAPINPLENTPELVPTRDIVTATQYSDKLNSGQGPNFSIEGIKWTTVAFNQVLARDDSPRQLDLGLDRSLQQYIRIRNLSLYLQGDGLTHSRDQETGISTLEATAIVYPGISVQPGDHFVGVDDNGRKLLMVASNITELSWRNDSALEFTVKLFDYASDAMLNNLDLKTIETYYYSDEGALCGKPLIKNEEVELNKSADAMIKELVDIYYDQFFNKETQSFNYPINDNILTYDGSVTNFFIRIVGTKWRGMHPRAMNYTVESVSYRDKLETVWDAMFSNVKLWRNRVSKTFELRSLEEYRSEYTFSHLAHSKYSQVVSPTKKDAIITDGNPEDNSNEGFYVFSSGFYDQDHSRVESKLESHLLSIMAGNEPSIELIEDHINDLIEKPLAKQYYEIPVVIWMLAKILI